MSIHLSILGRVDTTAPRLKLPLAGGGVRTGFPSPAEDYLEAELDLVAHLLQHPSATYYFRAKGTSMTGAGIYDGELTCKKLDSIGNRPYLFAATPEFRPMPLEGRECQVWGVVTHNIHSLAPGFSV
ncbi:LexA family protein [Halomonas sp. KO116]|uniref:LexA family protein n=1 Tax=Halomonas sp. KO116 TaxID=1504981 RepID=UPI0004E37600|nr:S24 family peptidase [Halomonas sp. KO116]AJY52509.1 hypothetical protein KO116_04046 [Halomonas sp. KO116]